MEYVEIARYELIVGCCGLGIADRLGIRKVALRFGESSPEVAKANIDVTKTWTNKYVEQVKKTTGASTK